MCTKVRASKTKHQTLSISITSSPTPTITPIFIPPLYTIQNYSTALVFSLLSSYYVPVSLHQNPPLYHTPIHNTKLLTKSYLLSRKKTYIALKHKSHNPSSTTLLDPLFSTVILPPTPESPHQKKRRRREKKKRPLTPAMPPPRLQTYTHPQLSHPPISTPFPAPPHPLPTSPSKHTPPPRHPRRRYGASRGFEVGLK